MVYKKIIEGGQTVQMGNLQEVQKFLLDHRVKLPISLFAFTPGIDVKGVWHKEEYGNMQNVVMKVNSYLRFLFIR